MLSIASTVDLPSPRVIAGVSVTETSLVNISYHSDVRILDCVHRLLNEWGYRSAYRVEYDSTRWRNTVSNPPIHVFDFW
jgi:hypothetical protein